MQKIKLIVIFIFTALVICSAFSVVAAQEETATSTPDSVPSATPINSPDQVTNSTTDNNSNLNDGNSVLYAIQGDNSTDANTTNPIMPGAERATGTPDNIWMTTAIGVVLAVVVGSVIGVVYFQKSKAKN